jgi:UDP-glucose:(heptosyl)LPS alpha-1,3-glucosyltransferase
MTKTRSAFSMDPMRLAFAIIRFFSWGGLQRDCLRLARGAKAAGHEVTILASRTDGELPQDIEVKILPVRALTNHGRNRRFARALAGEVAHNFDRVVGFDKMPGLDMLYCGDVCFADRKRRLWSKLNPRVGGMLALEAACFAPESKTRVLALTQAQIAAYRRAWGTPTERFVLLPPPIDAARRHPELRNDGTRERVRAELGLAGTALLSIGTAARTKGFDRVIAALPEIPNATAVICGLPPKSRDAKALLDQARGAGVANRVRLLGPRADVPELIAAADVYVHPARTETGGIAILEALVNGVPVVATEVCGFSTHVKSADAGMVIPEPFAVSVLAYALRCATDPSRNAAWSANAARYGKNPELYSGIDRALRAILEV